MSRSRATVYIALGGNLGDVRATFESALCAIKDVIGQVEARSSLYQTLPLKPPGKEAETFQNYLNAVIGCSTELSPTEVLSTLLTIERDHGRVRNPLERYAPRTIDLDILMYGAEVIDTPNLIVPHREIDNRDFVLVPLAEIAGDIINPRTGKTIRAALDAFLRSGQPRFILPDIISWDDREHSLSK